MAISFCALHLLYITARCYWPTGSDAWAHLAGTPLFLDMERLCRLAEIVTVEQTSLRAARLPPHTKTLQQQNETQQQLRVIAQQIKEFAQMAVTDIVRGVMENVN